MFDLGFLGVEKPSSTKIIITYQEGKRLRARCRTGKEYNKNHSAKRIEVEHVMSCYVICRDKKVQNNE